MHGDVHLNALVTGLKYGLISGSQYSTAAKNGWIALGNETNSSGQLSKVCPGTGQAYGSTGVGPIPTSQQNFYINLQSMFAAGDQHGQAPLLWSAIALLSNSCPATPYCTARSSAAGLTGPPSTKIAFRGRYRGSDAQRPCSRRGCSVAGPLRLRETSAAGGSRRAASSGRGAAAARRGRLAALAPLREGVPARAPLAEYQAGITQIVRAGGSATLQAAQNELSAGAERPPRRGRSPVENSPTGAGAVVLGTPASSTFVNGLGLGGALAGVGREGYLIRATTVGGNAAIVIAAQHRRRRPVRQRSPSCAGSSRSSRSRALSLAESRRASSAACSTTGTTSIGSVERGYARPSLWEWTALPGTLSPRYRDYARAERVDRHQRRRAEQRQRQRRRSSPREYLAKVAALAGVFRPYGIRVYLTAQFSAPIEIGGLKTADPLDPRGASVVEGEGRRDLPADPRLRRLPGQGELRGTARAAGLRRTHADGANMLADAVAPHGGVVMWRAFVYSDDVPTDRVEAGVQRVQAARRTSSRRQRDGPGEERTARLPAARAVLAALRRDAEDAADRWSSRSPRSTSARTRTSSISGADVPGGPVGRHVRERQGLDGRERDRRVAARLPTHRHRRRRRTSAPTATGRARTSTRPTGTRSAGWPGIPTARPADDRRRVDPPNVLQRSGGGGADRRR